jgi:hypothetical protein
MVYNVFIRCIRNIKTLSYMAHLKYKNFLEKNIIKIVKHLLSLSS